MFFTGFRGAPAVAQQWEASCRQVAEERRATLHTETLPLPQGAVLSLGWMSGRPFDIDALRVRDGDMVRAVTLPDGGGRLTADTESGRITVTGPLSSPEQIHHAQQNGSLFISNDSRLLLRFLGLEIDPTAVFAVLQIGGIPAPLSISRHIAKLPPGRTIRFGDAGAGRIAPFDWHPAGATILEETAETQIRSRLSAALPKRGAEPIVLFFSGGVDSAVLADQLKRDGHTSVTLVNYAFAPGDPEAAIAHEMAEHFGFPFVQLMPEESSIEHVLSRVGDEYSYPFGDVSTLPTNTMIHAALGRVAPESILVEGTGADGIMGLGSALAVWRHIARAPNAAVRLGAAGYRLFGMWRYGGRLRKLCWVMRTLSQMPLVDAAVLSQNSLEGIAYHMPDPVRQRLSAAIDLAYAEPSAGHEFDVRASITDLMHVCGGIFAAKSFDPVRSAGMRVVYPFLSPHLVELSALLSPVCKYRNGADKPILKAMLRQSAPSHLIDRQKRGFEPPMARYLRTPGFRAYLLDEVTSTDNPLMDYVDRQQTRRMIEYSGDHALTNREVHNYLWALTFLTAWLRSHGRSPARTA